MLSIRRIHMLVVGIPLFISFHLNCMGPSQFATKMQQFSEMQKRKDAAIPAIIINETNKNINLTYEDVQHNQRSATIAPQSRQVLSEEPYQVTITIKDDGISLEGSTIDIRAR